MEGNGWLEISMDLRVGTAIAYCVIVLISAITYVLSRVHRFRRWNQPATSLEPLITRILIVATVVFMLTSVGGVVFDAENPVEMVLRASVALALFITCVFLIGVAEWVIGRRRKSPVQRARGLAAIQYAGMTVSICLAAVGVTALIVTVA